ncbi:hypothetical protein F2Q69_00045615 [Brassica cretica]|uniref:Uncharacterized protein n=1 Tax=Brassica cretica TaxID=69181 RepID=A0A8S9NAC4_BRACR|nr:hypothetical protein F2Q69_00045615 [Brassica cretica]
MIQGFAFSVSVCSEKPWTIPRKFRGMSSVPRNFFGIFRGNSEELGFLNRKQHFASVPKKKGRLIGLGRRARSVPPSTPQPYINPEGLMDQLKDIDDRIAALEQKMADQEAGWEETRKQNEQMMEMMKRMYPKEQFP